MDQFLARFSKGTVAFVAIVAGIVGLLLYMPPVSLCDTQLEVIKESQKSFLFKDEKYPTSKSITTTRFQHLRDHCKATNNPGGCYELFQELKELLQDVATLPRECATSVGSVRALKNAMWDSLDLMVRLAWGDKPPASYHEKFGWLDTSDMALFCRLKAAVQLAFGESAFTQFREKTMLDLPGAKDISRNQIWDMSLFSENCSRYP